MELEQIHEKMKGERILFLTHKKRFYIYKLFSQRTDQILFFNFFLAKVVVLIFTSAGIIRSLVQCTTRLETFLYG